jgi:hypothetical protein
MNFLWQNCSVKRFDRHYYFKGETMKWNVSFFGNIICHSWLCVLLGLGLGTTARGMPMDPSNYAVAISLPSHLAGYVLMHDHADPNLIYVQPRDGRIGEKNGAPQISFGTAERNGLDYGVLNAVFDFSMDAKEMGELRGVVHEHNQRHGTRFQLVAMPFVQTTPELAIVGSDESEACAEVEDFVTGAIVKECFQLVHRSKTSKNGPALGEKIQTSLVLTPLGAELFPQLLKGGAGLGMNLRVLYRAAFPSFTAKIKVNYEKLYESYAWFAGYHDGVCTDLAISDFFEKEAMCDHSGRNGNGRECSVTIEYVDNLGKTHNNLFEYLPHADEDEDVEAFLAEHKQRVSMLHAAVEALQVKFETEMLEPFQGRKADVSKDISYGFVFRADRNRQEVKKNFTIERKAIGGAITKQSVIPAVLGCLDLDDGGNIYKHQSGICANFWNGNIRPAEILPVESRMSQSENGLLNF